MYSIIYSRAIHNAETSERLDPHAYSPCSSIYFCAILFAFALSNLHKQGFIRGLLFRFIVITLVLTAINVSARNINKSLF